MKIKIMIFSLLLSSSSLFAQWNTNGNFALPTDYLGTNNNQPLNVYTNGVQRMRINANTGATAGFVGINTVNPLFRLHVQGSGVCTALLCFSL